MKKHFISCSIFIPAALFIQQASCQPSINNEKGNTVGVTTEYNNALPANTATDYKNAVNIKAVRNFIKIFNNAKNVTWSKTNNGGYVARFIADSIPIMVTYNSEGSWNYTIKTYAENKMPADVRAMIKSIYFDYTITEIKEITLWRERADIIYSVLIKYADNFKIVQICNKEMEIVGDYTKP